LGRIDDDLISLFQFALCCYSSVAGAAQLESSNARSMAAPADAAVDYCKLANDHSLARWERNDAHHHCQGSNAASLGGVDNAVRLIGGFLGAADGAVNSEMAVEATDRSYGDYHADGASVQQIGHAHNMQHSDIAMRAISEMLGFSHQMLAPSVNGQTQNGQTPR
jgi:hypothetical protein